jgi:hypothetical protein
MPSTSWRLDGMCWSSAVAACAAVFCDGDGAQLAFQTSVTICCIIVIVTLNSKLSHSISHHIQYHTNGGRYNTF